jgi:hypothetical protein
MPATCHLTFREEYELCSLRITIFPPSVLESNTSLKNHFVDIAMCVRLEEGINSITT